MYTTQNNPVLHFKPTSSFMLAEKLNQIRHVHLFKFILSSLFFISQSAFSNNIKIQNLQFNAYEEASGVVSIVLDLSWDHSWYYTAQGPGNYDAAWIFFKYLGIDGIWHHAYLDEYQIPYNSATIEIPDDSDGKRKGAFIYQQHPGANTFSEMENLVFTGLPVRLELSGTGIVPPASPVIMKAFAIEMIYVPEGSFFAGSPDPTGCIIDEDTDSIDVFAFSMTEITTSDARVDPVEIDYYHAGGYPYGQPVPASSDFPNGFNGFYCMKYELTQSQYVDFLNCLNSEEAAIRYFKWDELEADTEGDGEIDNFSQKEASRYEIHKTDTGYISLNPYLALNYLSWTDGAAYADWAALRPMTELEYEKVCRGDKIPVIGSYAWGSEKIYGLEYDIENVGQENEIISNPAILSTDLGNALFNKTEDRDNQGAVRVGIFAATATASGGIPNRMQTGGSYYGIMELTGNVMDRCIGVQKDTVDITNPECEILGSALFDGRNGDGELLNGTANVHTWPVSDGSDETSGVAARGGSFIKNYMRA
ncbi:MAG: SUMF1/EgtB/PvdO family nonheme iron enzyme, partial [Chitinophagales bacterium]|nr:SUMF1/EgtB/PvdO family nonheme iron enzyme [Chitinophagales bacterium]